MEQIAIIGAGLSGLVSLKTALDHGYNVKVFEMEPSYGGIWNYQSPSEARPGFVDLETDNFVYPMYKSMKTNTAAYTTYFSDFQLEESRGYLTHTQVMDYMSAYMDRFDLHQYIQYNSKIIRIDKDGCQWIITYEQNGETLRETFQKLLIATGNNRYPLIPVFKNSDLFQGVFIHSSQVRDEEALFSGKRVLIIGGAHTGGELAYFASKANASHVFMIQSSRARQSLLWNRFVESSDGTTMEWDYKRTYENCVDSKTFGAVLKDMSATIDGRAPEKVPVVSKYKDIKCCVHSREFLKEQIDCGKLTHVKSLVAALGESSVTLTDGSTLPNLDIIVAGTGFITKFPFLDHILDQEKPRRFYHRMLPTDKSLDGLGFVMIMKAGPNFPTAELQARWLCQNFLPKRYISDTGVLYTDGERQEMEQEIARLLEELGPAGYNIEGQAYVYMDKLAKDIGALPPDHNQLLASTELSDVELGVALFHGPITSLRFRIARDRSTPELEVKLVKFVKDVIGTSQFQSHVEKYVSGVNVK